MHLMTQQQVTTEKQYKDRCPKVIFEVGPYWQGGDRCKYFGETSIWKQGEQMKNSEPGEKKWKEGRKEGRQEGRKEGRKEKKGRDIKKVLGMSFREGHSNVRVKYVRKEQEEAKMEK